MADGEANDRFDAVIGAVLDEVLNKYLRPKNKALRWEFVDYQAAHSYFTRRTIYGFVWKTGCPMRDAIRADLALRSIIATEALDELIAKGAIVLTGEQRLGAAPVSAKPTRKARGTRDPDPAHGGQERQARPVTLPQPTFEIEIETRPAL